VLRWGNDDASLSGVILAPASWQILALLLRLTVIDAGSLSHLTLAGGAR
jgi:hypothetical protein